MQKLMIIDDNILHIQNIVNYISKNMIDIKLYNIVFSNNTEVFEMIKNKEIDILIVNIDLVGFDIIKYIVKNSIDFYSKSIIILYNDSKYLLKKYTKEYNNYIFKCLRNSEDTKLIIKKLNELYFIKEKNADSSIIINKIERELKKLNYNFNHIGTRYILFGIKELYDKKVEKINLTKQMYFILSQKYNKSINTIKGDITQATINMYYNCNEDIIKKYFKYLDYVAKPTVKEIITTILDKIQL